MKTKALYTIVLLTLAFTLAFTLAIPAGQLLAQPTTPTVSIVLKMVMPHIQPVNNINLPGFSFHFENNSEQFVLFETAISHEVKTKCLRYILTDPFGSTHMVTPVAEFHSRSDDGSNHTILYPEEKTKPIRHHIQETLAQHFWEWWQDPLWAPGDYRLTIAYIPDPNREYGNTQVVRDTMFSNTIFFTIHETSQFLPEPDHAHKINKGYIRGQREEEHYQHIRYANAEGQITAERIYITQRKTYTEPIFELVYDQPIIPEDSIHWRLVYKEIHTGHGSRHIPYWVPTVPNEKLNGQARTWHYQESYSRKGRPLANAQFANGTLNGPVEIYLDGNNITGFYRDGKRENVWVVWRDTTVIFRAEFKDDKFHGDYMMAHYNNPGPWRLATYDQGKLHGAYESYYENGQIKEYFEYDHGAYSGLAVWYTETGEELARGMYLDGKPYNGTFYSRMRGSVAGGGRFRKGPKQPFYYKEGILQVAEEDVPKRRERKGSGR